MSMGCSTASKTRSPHTAMPDVCFIGVDTSNYTTSLAAVDGEGRVLANLKAPLPVQAGARGLRQSDAVFAHVKNLPVLTEELRRCVEDRKMLAAGVSKRPRDAEDSYMPCFLVGVSAAYALAAGFAAPVFEFSHQSGHMMAALASSGAPDAMLERPFGAFHVSGGTTDLLYVTPRDGGFDIERIGGSADLHAGQAVDRIGVAMGLSFPCGPALERLADDNHAAVPHAKIAVNDGICHLSGLENRALDLFQKTQDAPLTAAFTFDFIAKTLLKIALWARDRHPGLPLVFAGGVMSNRRIAATLAAELGEGVYFAEPAFSADNAAGVALLCRRRYLMQS